MITFRSLLTTSIHKVSKLVFYIASLVEARICVHIFYLLFILTLLVLRYQF